MDSKGTVDISNSIQKCPVTLDRISLGYRKAQMVLVFIRSMKVTLKIYLKGSLNFCLKIVKIQRLEPTMSTK